MTAERFLDISILLHSISRARAEASKRDRELYTEDLAHGREVKGVRIINLFR
jgi:hypothetical protein